MATAPVPLDEIVNARLGAGLEQVQPHPIVRPDLGIAHASHGEVGRHCRLDAAGAALALHGRVEQVHVGRVGAVRREDRVHLDVDAGVRRHAGAADGDASGEGEAGPPRPVADLADAAVQSRWRWHS